ncbi:hypothetical protein PWR63_19870 [Paraburkholderia sp. A2WS-5]|uniref:hypothetical protein n=1 Tax=unclassified Paraburkholderia TaxID=2615204 RepID=UPI003B7A771D
MKDAVTGRGVARLGDTTDHGGKVIVSATNFAHSDVCLAFIGDQTAYGLDYVEPDSSHPEALQKLPHANIKHAYEILTPEQRARDPYGNPGASK